MRKITLETCTPINIALKAGLICTASEDKIAGYEPESFLSKLVKLFSRHSNLSNLSGSCDRICHPVLLF